MGNLSSEPPGPARGLLLVEDDADSRSNLRRILEGAGYVVACAGDGHDALAYLRGHPPPGLILLDLMMPGMDGAEFRRLQAQDPALAAIPVVVVSAFGAEAAQHDRFGEVGYLQKPVDVPELLAAVERFLAAPRPEILVVEDEPAVLTMLEIALRHFGFRVRQAWGGHEALRQFERHRGTIDLVLLDVQMPDLDGPHTLDALRALDPTVPVVFMSGSTGSYSAEELRRRGGAAVLQKPFRNLTELTQTLWRYARQRT